MSDYPEGLSDADIAGALAEEDFFDDFLPRQEARSPFIRAVRHLGQLVARDPALAAAIDWLNEGARQEQMAANNPRVVKGKGVHRGQVDGALCRQLLVLSVYAAHRNAGVPLEAFVPDHDLSWPAWQKWIDDDVVRSARKEVQRTGLLPEDFGIRHPIPTELWPVYAQRIGWLSGRSGKKEGNAKGPRPRPGRN